MTKTQTQNSTQCSNRCKWIVPLLMSAAVFWILFVFLTPIIIMFITDTGFNEEISKSAILLIFAYLMKYTIVGIMSMCIVGSFIVTCFIFCACLVGVDTDKPKTTELTEESKV